MTISFDLDDTLIPGTKRFDTEQQTILHRLLGIEKIRLGTIVLFKELRNKGHRIYIYTTSFRSAVKIKMIFHFYGVPIDTVINQQRHDRQLRENRKRSSKYPPAFDIDVHVDDSPGVEIEGKTYGFKTIIVAEHDKAWAKIILDKL